MLIRALFSLATTSLLAASLLTTGCTFSDGDAWGDLTTTLTAQHDFVANETSDGFLRTSRGYLIDVRDVSMVVDGIEWTLEGEGASTFDPANPPPGYSLCHNGHCHAADGRLVDYEDIIQELAGGGAKTSIWIAADASDHPVRSDATSVPLDACGAACQLSLTTLHDGAVIVHSVHLDVQIFDEKTGADARIGEAGLHVTATLELEQRLPFQTTITTGRGKKPTIHAALALRLLPELFDRFDWAGSLASEGAFDLSDDAAFREQFAAALEENHALDVTLARRR